MRLPYHRAILFELMKRRARRSDGTVRCSRDTSSRVPLRQPGSHPYCRHFEAQSFKVSWRTRLAFSFEVTYRFCMRTLDCCSRLVCSFIFMDLSLRLIICSMLHRCMCVRWCVAAKPQASRSTKSAPAVVVNGVTIARPTSSLNRCFVDQLASTFITTLC